MAFHLPVEEELNVGWAHGLLVSVEAGEGFRGRMRLDIGGIACAVEGQEKA